MRALKIIIFILLVVIISFAIGTYIFLKTFNIAKFKPQIIKQISSAVGRDVNIQDLRLNLSLESGIMLGIKSLSIADDPEFSKDNFLKIDDINFGVDISTFITQRQLIVSSINLKSPKIILIRNKNGRFNLEKFGASQEPSAAGANSSHEPPHNPGSNAEAGNGSSGESTSTDQVRLEKMLATLLIKSIEVHDGKLIYIDRMFNPEMTVPVTHLELKVDNFSLLKSFRFSGEGSLFSERKNIKIDGTGQLDMRNTAFHAQNVQLSGDLSAVSIDELKRSFVAFKGMELLKELSGTFQGSMDKLSITSKGLAALTHQGKVINGRAKLATLALPLEPINLNLHVTGTDIVLKDSSLGLGTGKITLHGSVHDYLKEQYLDVNIAADHIDLGKVIAQEGQPIELQGILQAGFDIKGKGLNGPEFLPSLFGTGQMEIQEGRLTNINVLRLVLSKISMLPGLVEKIEKNLPEHYKEKLKEKDTPLRKILLKARLENGVLLIDSADVIADVFALSGGGRMDFDQNLSLSSAVSIPADLSGSMVSSVEELKFLLDESGKIIIPISINGKIPNLSYVPDLEYLGKRILVNTGRQELQKVLDKVFKKEEGADTPPREEGQNNPQTPQEDSQQKRPEQEIIENILDKIFK